MGIGIPTIGGIPNLVDGLIASAPAAVAVAAPVAVAAAVAVDAAAVVAAVVTAVNAVLRSVVFRPRGGTMW